METIERITQRPDVMGGKPCVRGMRVTVGMIVGQIMAATGGRKPSVVQIRSDQLSRAVIGAHIVAPLEQLASELAQGALLTVEPGRTRVSLLPLQPNR